MTRPASAPQSVCRVCTAPRQSLGKMTPATHGEAIQRGQFTWTYGNFHVCSMFSTWSTLTIQMEIINRFIRFPIIGKSYHGLSHSKCVSHPFTDASNIQWRTCKGRGAPQRGLGRKAWGTSRNIVEIVDILYIYIMWIIWIIYNTMYIIVYMYISIMMFTCFDSMCMYICIFSDWGVVHHPKLALYTSTRPKLHITDDLNNHKRPYKYHECGWIK